MKQLLIILITIVAFIPGCNSIKKTGKKVFKASIDSTVKVDEKRDKLKVETVKVGAIRKEKEVSSNKNISITKGEKEVTVDPYTITANFKIDTTAKGDTIRLVSQENEAVKFQVYYDKRTGQVMAQIEGKGRKIKTTFDQINISNATIKKDVDSSNYGQGDRVVSDKGTSKVKAKVKKNTVEKEKTKDVKRRASIPIYAIGFVVLAALIYLLIKYKK